MKEIKINKTQLKMIIMNYYSESYEEVKVVINVGKQEGDYFRGDYVDTSINVIINNKINGMEFKETILLNDEEVKKIIQQFFKNEGHELINIDFDRGLNSKTVGYYMSEQTIDVPYFNGVTARFKVNEKDKRRELI